MDPATSATPSPTLRPTSVYPPQNKGKQRAEWPLANEMSPLLTADGELSDIAWTLVENNYEQIHPLTSGDPGSSIGASQITVNGLRQQADIAFTALAKNSKFISGCKVYFDQIDKEHIEKINLKAELSKLKEACETQLEAIANLKKNHQIDAIAKFSLGPETISKDSFLQVRFAMAAALLNSVCQIIDALVDDAAPESRINELDAYIQDMLGEVSILGKSLPSPAKAFLWVVGFALILVPLVTTVWYILGSLGWISMTAALPKAVGGCGWLILVIASIVESWPRFKNACAEKASEAPRKLITSHQDVLTIYEGIIKKMSDALSSAGFNFIRSGAQLTAVSVGKTLELTGKTLELTDQTRKLSNQTRKLGKLGKKVEEDTADIKQKLDAQTALLKQFTSRTPAASPDPDAKDRKIAELEKQLAQQAATIANLAATINSMSNTNNKNKVVAQDI